MPAKPFFRFVPPFLRAIPVSLRITMLALAGLLTWTCDPFDTAGKDSDVSDSADSAQYPDDEDSAGVNHAPTIGLGLHNVSMLEGESKTIVLKAKDEDGDPVRFEVLNLDSLRALFPDGDKAIEILTGGDSLIIGFIPGRARGNYRFRIAARDSFGGIDVQILAISVGKVNHPPSVAFAAPAKGTAFKVREGATLSLRITTEDDDGDALTLLSLANPPWPRFGQGEYDTETGQLTFKPSFQAVAAGETTFSDLVFRAKDKGDPPETGQISARITVQDSNTAPRWNAERLSLPGREGGKMSLDLAPLFLGDAEGDGVEFTADLGGVDKASLIWTYTPGFRDAGSRECVVTVSDSHRPPLSSRLILALDIGDSARAVDVAITAPVDGFLTRDSIVAVSWTVGDREQTGETSEALRNEGANVIRRFSRDSLGDASGDSVTVFRDTRPPLPPKVSVPALWNSPLPKWIWTSRGDDGGGAGDGKGVGNGVGKGVGKEAGLFRISLDNVDLNGSGLEIRDTAFIPPANLAEGRHVLYAQERDEAGNWSAPDSGAVVLDLTAPLVRILSPLAGAVLSDASVPVTWTLDGVTQTSRNSEPLSGEGPIHIRRDALDEAGNRGGDSILVIRKVEAASAPLVLGPAGPSREPEWSWIGAPGGTGTFRLGWEADAWFDTLQATRFTGPPDLAEGEHTLYVSELGRGAAGGWSAQGSFQVTVDRTPPTLRITGPDLESSVTSLDPAITGTVEEANGVPAIRYVSPMGEGQAALAGASWSIAASYPDGDQTVTVTAEDSAGNRSGPQSVVIRKRSNTVFVRKGFSGQGTSWRDAYGEVFRAFAGPGEAGRGLKVWIAEGEYPTAANPADPLNLPSQAEIYGGFNPDGSGKGLSDRNLSELKTTLRGGGSSGAYAVQLQGQGVILDGIRITGSSGALLSPEGNLVRNCRIDGTGGLTPILISGARGEAFRMEDSRIEGNRAADKAALVIDAGMAFILGNSSITGNASSGAGSGGGIWIGGNAKLTAAGSALAGNTVADGAGGRAIQAHVESGAELDFAGSVEGGWDGFDVMPQGRVRLNGESRDSGGGF